LHSELVALRIERNNDQQSSTQAAAALAATNAARQAEMEMQIEKMQKDIGEFCLELVYFSFACTNVELRRTQLLMLDTKRREIDTIKAQLQERDVTSAHLKEEVNNLRDELVHYKEKVASEDELKAQALQAIADKEYFEEDERSLTSMNSSSRLGLFSRFSRSKNNVNNASDYTFESDGNDRDKDSRIEQLEKTVTENVLIISNLKKELVSASLKFNKDESQRRMLISRLENENQAYSVKLEVLENEFNELKKRRESSKFDANKSSTFDQGIEQMKNKSFGQSFFTAASDHSYENDSAASSMSGVSAVTGASQMHPLERDNKKLKKQKLLYENRVSFFNACCWIFIAHSTHLCIL
jgi:chromosome segregation ATPase